MKILRIKEKVLKNPHYNTNILYLEYDINFSIFLIKIRFIIKITTEIPNTN